MTTGIETKIFRALTDWLDDYVAANPIDLAVPGVDFTPTPGTQWLRASFLPASARAITVNLGANEYRGVFQIDVFYPEGRGAPPALEAASSLAAWFKRGTQSTHEAVTITVTQPPSVAGPLQEPGWIQVPVSISYLALVANP